MPVNRRGSDALRGIPCHGYGRPAQVWNVIGSWSDPITDGDEPIVSLYLLDVGDLVGGQRVRLSVDGRSACYVGPAGGREYGINRKAVA